MLFRFQLRLATVASIQDPVALHEERRNVKTSLPRFAFIDEDCGGNLTQPLKTYTGESKGAFVSTRLHSCSARDPIRGTHRNPVVGVRP